MSRKHGLLRSLALSIGIAVTSVAFAPTASAQTTAPPQDVVLLRNGGMVRGTIIELQPKQYVEVLRVDGEKQRFSMNDVSYAGPATEVPRASGPSRDAAGNDQPQAHLALVAAQPDVTVLRRTAHAQATASGPGGWAQASGDEYAELCGAPCEVSLPAGRYTLALSQGHGNAVDADPIDVPAGRSKIEATYVSHSGRRIAALVVAMAGAAAGLTMIVVGGLHQGQTCDDQGCRDTSDPDVPLLLGGVGAIFGGVLLTNLLFKGDEAILRIVPLSTARIRRSFVQAGREGSGLTPGLSLSLDW